MQFFPVGKVYDFMGARRLFAIISFSVTFAAAVLIFVKPGPELGTDFKGGTEVEVDFKQTTEIAEIRNAVVAAGFSQPEVIRVTENKARNRYLIRVQEVSTISAAKQAEIAKALCVGENLSPTDCPE